MIILTRCYNITKCKFVLISYKLFIKLVYNYDYEKLQ